MWIRCARSTLKEFHGFCEIFQNFHDSLIDFLSASYPPQNRSMRKNLAKLSSKLLNYLLSHNHYLTGLSPSSGPAPALEFASLRWSLRDRLSRDVLRVLWFLNLLHLNFVWSATITVCRLPVFDWHSLSEFWLVNIVSNLASNAQVKFHAALKRFLIENPFFETRKLEGSKTRALLNASRTRRAASI